jgi:pilus assembly protein CpaE
MSDKESREVIKILLVDDIPETRENIKKLLSFEGDFKIVGTAGTGKEGVELARQFKPDIILMDINMPDMDGLQATSIITKAVPTAAVIIMSVQDDTDYMRRAMLAGARNFLSKPINMDELYTTIRTVYRDYEGIRRSFTSASVVTPMEALRQSSMEARRDRGGHIILLYSPQGGAGTTTLAVNIAAGLMRDGARVLLVDGDMQFGDVPTFLNLQGQATLVDMLPDADDVDAEHFDNLLVTHESGLKVLLGPQRPEFADEIRAKPEAPAKILRTVRGNYDFIVIDTSVTLDDVTLELMALADKILVISTTGLTSIKNVRFVLDLFDQLEYAPSKTMLVLNKVYPERERKNALLSPERIESFLKRKIEAQIPQVDERLILSAVLKGVPLIAYDRDQSKPPVRQILDLAEMLNKEFTGGQEPGETEGEKKKKGGIGLRLGR